MDGVSKGRSGRRPPSAGGVRYFSCFLQVRHASLGRRWLRKEHLVQIDTLGLGTEVNYLKEAALGKETLLNWSFKDLLVTTDKLSATLNLKPTFICLLEQSAEDVAGSSSVSANPPEVCGVSETLLLLR